MSEKTTKRRIRLEGENIDGETFFLEAEEYLSEKNKDQSSRNFTEEAHPFYWVLQLLQLTNEHRFGVSAALILIMGISGTFGMKMAKVRTQTQVRVVEVVKYRYLKKEKPQRQQVSLQVISSLKAVLTIQDESVACKQRLAHLRILMGEESFLQVVGTGNCKRRRRSRRYRRRKTKRSRRLRKKRPCPCPKKKRKKRKSKRQYRGRMVLVNN